LTDAKGRFLFLVDAVLMEMEADPYLLKRVDKAMALSAIRAEDLVALDGLGASPFPDGTQAEKARVRSAEGHEQGCGGEGLTTFSFFTYRSYGYQENLYARNVAELGALEASRFRRRGDEPASAWNCH
jgi:hypothetical protein